jgi:HK97 family phage major capsid protein
MDVVELRRKRSELLAAMKALAEGELTDETRAQFDAKTAEMDKVGADLQRAETLQQAEQRVAHQVSAPNVLKIRPGDSEERAMGHYIRTGDRSGLEQRASNDTDMNIGTAADGGNAVPTGHYNGIIARRDEQMLSAKLGVMNIPGKGLTVNVPIDNEDDGEFITKAEATAFDRDAPAIGTVAMTLAKYTKTIQLSDELLADEDSKLMAFLNNWVGRAMAKTYNQLFITELKANGTAALSLASATVIAAGEVPALLYKLPAEYTDNAAWIMSRTVEGEIFALADTSDWRFGMKGASDPVNRTLWNYPVHNSAYCTETVASSKSLIFGNFSFVGHRDGGMQFLRNPYLLGNSGQVALHYHFRTVYKVLQSEAIVYASHPSA